MERPKEKKYNDLFYVPVGANVPIVLETGGRMTENTRRALSTYIRWDIMGKNNVEWTWAAAKCIITCFYFIVYSHAHRSKCCGRHTRGMQGLGLSPFLLPSLY